MSALLSWESPRSTVRWLVRTLGRLPWKSSSKTRTLSLSTAGTVNHHHHHPSHHHLDLYVAVPVVYKEFLGDGRSVGNAKSMGNSTFLDPLWSVQKSGVFPMLISHSTSWCLTLGHLNGFWGQGRGHGGQQRSYRHSIMGSTEVIQASMSRILGSSRVIMGSRSRSRSLNWVIQTFSIHLVLSLRYMGRTLRLLLSSLMTQIAPFLTMTPMMPTYGPTMRKKIQYWWPLYVDDSHYRSWMTPWFSAWRKMRLLHCSCRRKLRTTSCADSMITIDESDYSWPPTFL